MPAELSTSSTPHIAQHTSLSPDIRAMMLFEANKKTALVAYILCPNRYGPDPLAPSA